MNRLSYSIDTHFTIEYSINILFLQLCQYQAQFGVFTFFTFKKEVIVADENSGRTLPAQAAKLRTIIHQAHLWRTHRNIAGFTYEGEDDRITNLEEGWPELEKLLETFIVFVSKYENFIDRIAASTPALKNRILALSNDGIKQLMEDWDVISRACQQRVVTGFGHDEERFEMTGELLRATEQMKEYQALWNERRGIYSKHGALESMGKPIVYFEKKYKIRRSLYARNTPIVAIPLTEARFSNDKAEKEALANKRYLALAHEFGHHLFWNAVDTGLLPRVFNAISTIGGKTICGKDWSLAEENDQKEKNPEVGRSKEAIRLIVWMHWFEEVFADVVGTLLEGPAYAIKAQEIAAQACEARNDLVKADDEHPAPYLRPLICVEVLKRVDFDDWQPLQQAWEAFIQLDETRGLLKISGQPVSDFVNDIGAVVDGLLNQKIWPDDSQLEPNIALLDMLSPVKSYPKPIPFKLPDPLPDQVQSDEVRSKLDATLKKLEELQGLSDEFARTLGFTGLGKSASLVEQVLSLALLSDTRLHDGVGGQHTGFASHWFYSWHNLYIPSHSHDVDATVN